MGYQNEDILILDYKDAELISEAFKVLGHPVRLQIITILSQGERCVSNLSEITKQNQAIVSQQLKILKFANFVKADRRNRHSYYSLTRPEIIKFIDCLKNCKLNISGMS